MLEDPDVWLPPHLRRLLAKYPPLKRTPKPEWSETWATLLAEEPRPWNPKRPPKVKIKVRLKMGPRKRRTAEQIRRYKRQWMHKKRERLRAEGKLPPLRRPWKKRNVRRPGMRRTHLQRSKT